MSLSFGLLLDPVVGVPTYVRMLGAEIGCVGPGLGLWLRVRLQPVSLSIYSWCKGTCLLDTPPHVQPVSLSIYSGLFTLDLLGLGLGLELLLDLELRLDLGLGLHYKHDKLKWAVLTLDGRF